MLASTYCPWRLWHLGQCACISLHQNLRFSYRYWYVILASACKLSLCKTHLALKSIPNSLRVYSKWPWINNHGLSGIFKQLWWIINYNTFNNVVLQFVFVRINQVYTYIVAAIVLKIVARSRERENKLVFDNITVLIGFCNITQDKRKVSQNFLTSIISSNLIYQTPNNRVIVCLDLLNHQNTCTHRCVTQYPN